MPSWHFREMARGEINVDPVHDEFFKAQDLADALVREAIQNSLDARRGRAVVRVRFRIGTTETRYLDGLEPHVELPRFAAMPFLAVEDAGTRGLIGNPDEDPEIDEEAERERNDWYYFWRNVGRSGKGELDRGRWGLGKAVFAVSSRIHAMFGVTRRSDDGRLLLLGQHVGRTHVLDGRRFAPYAFFARMGRDAFPHPIDDTSNFLEHFGLQRDEPGLSIVIPFHREEELKSDALLASVIRQYFYPITRGDLIVTIEESGRSETITGRTIERETTDENLVKICELARWSMALPDSEWITLAEPPATGAPKWSEDVIPARQLDALRARLERNEKLAFRVPLHIRRKHRGTAASSYFSVVLERDDSLKKGHHTFIRRGITIPEVRAPRERPVRALLIADDDAISTFLGDAENPAHSDWSERNDKIRMLYENGASTLRYVKNAIEQIAASLSAPPEGRAPDLLADVFAVSVAGESVASGGGEGRADARHAGEGADAPQAVAKGSDLRIVPIAGGFTISGTKHDGERYRAEVAYRTRSGDPFRKYSPFDFAIGRAGVAVKHEGIDLGVARDNRIEFQPHHPGFQVTVTGFDRRRDLVVRVTKLYSDSDAIGG